MIPPDWQPHRRPADGELVGYLASEPAGTVPLNLLGLPLAAAGDRAAAVAVLESRALASLAEAWWLSDGGDPVEVRILEASPDRIRVVEAPYGYYGPESARHILEPPVTALSPRP